MKESTKFKIKNLAEYNMLINYARLLVKAQQTVYFRSKQNYQKTKDKSKVDKTKLNFRGFLDIALWAVFDAFSKLC